MRTALVILAVVTILAFLPQLFRSGGGNSIGPVPEGLPWQIDIQPDGRSRVFGLTLGRSTLDDARNRFKLGPQVAVVTAPGEQGSLEAYFESVTAGFVTGKIILTLDVPPETIAELRRRAAKTEYMESTTRKSTLSAEDGPLADRAPIRSIAFIPSAGLDEAAILQRFGAPAERLSVGEHIEHFLYPAKGLDVVLNAKGKELLQYVAPADFYRLRQPLDARPAAAGGM
ncbi:MAG: hypothetical protein KJ787_10640 [Gammaproteobacteria bacterium]|nr:hypothetical protein [Gammaproteobacteria bacterium]MBU1646779.1 hypothetical protein [Gammaproteobacteria bacterium]MBU1971547.1 hypothetical protein [Gammaproteobacteria bacterium]